MTDYGGQPHYQGGPGGHGGGVAYQEDSQATMILILGILGLLLCQVLSPIAWIMGNRELRAIDGGIRPPSNRDQARIGQILGIIGTVLIGLAAVALIVGVLMVVLLGVAESSVSIES